MRHFEVFSNNVNKAEICPAKKPRKIKSQFSKQRMQSGNWQDDRGGRWWSKCPKELTIWIIWKRSWRGQQGVIRRLILPRGSKEGRCPYYIEECISNQLLFCLKPPPALKLSSRSVSQHLTELEFSMHNPTLYHFQQNFTIKIWDFSFIHLLSYFFFFLGIVPLSFSHYFQRPIFVHKLKMSHFSF